MLNYKSAKTWRSVLLTSLLDHQTSTKLLFESNEIRVFFDNFVQSRL